MNTDECRIRLVNIRRSLFIRIRRSVSIRGFKTNVFSVHRARMDLWPRRPDERPIRLVAIWG